MARNSLERKRKHYFKITQWPPKYLYHGVVDKKNVHDILREGLRPNSCFGIQDIAERFADSGTLFRIPFQLFDPGAFKPDKGMVDEPYYEQILPDADDDFEWEEIQRRWEEWEASPKTGPDCYRLFGSLRYANPMPVTQADIVQPAKKILPPAELAAILAKIFSSETTHCRSSSSRSYCVGNLAVDDPMK
jgi:hypothetical protein